MAITKASKWQLVDYTITEVDSFYSAVYDVCIHTERSIIGNDFKIADLSFSLFSRDDVPQQKYLLTCDRNGANSVILKAVIAHRGRMAHVPYKDWLDDGFGGPPATLKAPDVPYTKAQCELLFAKWIALLKAS